MENDVQILERLIKKRGSAAIVRRDFNEYWKRTGKGKKLSAPEISKYGKGDRKMHPVFSEWLKDQAFIHLTPWGSYVEVVAREDTMRWFRGLLSLLKLEQYEAMDSSVLLRLLKTGLELLPSKLKE